MNKPLLQACLVIVLVWTVLCAIGALGSYVDHLNRGEIATYARMLRNWWSAHFLMMLMSCASYAFLARRPAILASAAALAARYAALLLVFLPIEVMYVAMLDLIRAATPVSLADVAARAVDMSRFNWFLEFAWLTFTFVTIVAVCVWRERGVREKAWAQTQHDNLQLRLDLEQQRLLALRGQLEPHFLFNALNAISALVRSDDKRVALGAIGNLGELLRYALQAGERERVTLADECRFVADYLALQKLRYGARLHIHIEGDDAHALAAEVPPLLLQPLIENALRHDLDCHDGASDIRLVFGAVGDQLTIHVSNPASAHRSPNPGLGLGLRHTRERLQLAYGAKALLDSGIQDGRFQVHISLPRAA